MRVIEGGTGETYDVTFTPDGATGLIDGEPFAIGSGAFTWIGICDDCGGIEPRGEAESRATVLRRHVSCNACYRKHALALDGSPECPICAEPGTFKPSHMGSPTCKSGSLASGGLNAHCTCDTCF